jgi:CRP-like cAMP-binding protein
VLDANHFLAGLSAADRAFLAPNLSRVTLKRSEPISEAGDAVTQAYCPINSILSVIIVMRNGRMIESRTIGRESGYGLLHALGSRYAYERVEVQVGGEAWAIPVQALAELARKSPEALITIVKHAQATIVQSAVTVACNTLHPADRRLCRWLLMTGDRLQSTIVPLTQEHLAMMLGVQRTTVTAALGVLEDQGRIRRRRGVIELIDLPKMKACACECHETIEESVTRLLA